MAGRKPFELQPFDLSQVLITDKRQLPHWSQAGAICFITWRTADSLPRATIERMNRTRQELLRQFDLNPSSNWRKKLVHFPSPIRSRLKWKLFTNWDDELDRAAGACPLRDPALSKIVMDSLLHFDNDRYLLTDAVVMPNHVHLLVAFRDEESLLKQCTSWKHFTALQINKRLRGTAQKAPPSYGEFWQVEQFDHLVRSPEEFDRYRRYIAENPIRAKLPPTAFHYFSKGQLT